MSAEYLGEPRFVVRETDGWVSSAASGSYQPMLFVAVLDRAYCCTKIRGWGQEDYRTGGRPPSTTTGAMVRDRIRAEAHALAVELNARHA